VWVVVVVVEEDSKLAEMTDRIFCT